jgi:hypothetical protein
LNDWQSLRAICSTQSRNEDCLSLPYEVSAGSRLVEHVLNPLKSNGYYFLDLIKPQNELLALLLVAMEPEIRWQWRMIAQVFRTSRQQAVNDGGTPPTKLHNVSSAISEEPLPWRESLEREFGPAFQELFDSNTRPVGALDWVALSMVPQQNGVRAIIRRGESIPAAQLRRIQAAMAPLLVPDDMDTAQYGRAARRMNAAGFQTVPSIS